MLPDREKSKDTGSTDQGSHLVMVVVSHSEGHDAGGRGVVEQEGAR